MDQALRIAFRARASIWAPPSRSHASSALFDSASTLAATGAIGLSVSTNMAGAVVAFGGFADEPCAPVVLGGSMLANDRGSFVNLAPQGDATSDGLPRSVERGLTAEAQFTTEFEVDANQLVSVSISGIFGMLVVLQRMFEGEGWRDVALPNGDPGWTDVSEMQYITDEGCLLRLGVKTGDYTSGTAHVRLGVN